jgi:hypothetical protein
MGMAESGCSAAKKPTTTAAGSTIYNDCNAATRKCVCPLLPDDLIIAPRLEPAARANAAIDLGAKPVRQWTKFPGLKAAIDARHPKDCSNFPC